MTVLDHSNARWDREDFDVLPLQQPAPRFLQPDHEPKMRLSSIASPWDYSNRVLPAPRVASPSGFSQDVAPTFGKAALHTRAEQDRWYQPARSMISSPLSPKPRENVSSFQLPASENNAHLWSMTDQDDAVDPSQLDLNRMPQQAPFFYSRRETNDSKTWVEGESELFEQEDSLDSDQISWSTGPIDSLPIGRSSLLRRPEFVTAISPHQSVLAVRPGLTLTPDPFHQNGSPYLENHSLAMPQPTKDRSRNAADAQLYATEHSLPSRESQTAAQYLEQLGPDVPQSNTASKYSRVERGGPYVHALCGKRFGSRYKVRKHHWGNEMDNINTTTGCWYKHKKPNRNWDDHPTCKEHRKIPTSARQKTESGSRDKKARTVPAMSSRFQDAPQDLSDPCELQTTCEQSSTRPDSLAPFGDEDRKYTAYLPYHIHSLPPSSSPFESLLTAVNVAAEIESPIPQIPNGWVVASDLTARAIAAERVGEFNYAWQNHKAGHESTFDYHEPLAPHHTGIIPRIGNASMAHSIRPSLAHPLHHDFEDAAFSSKLNPGAVYRHSYLNSRNPIALAPPEQTSNHYLPSFSALPREDRTN